MKTPAFSLLLAATLIPAVAFAKHHSEPAEATDEVVAEQRAALAANTDGMGFGPQSPRDIDSKAGTNQRLFGTAPASTDMSLCNIHFHKFAEHKGGEFTTYAGNGDGKGHNTGYVFSGDLSDQERSGDAKVCVDKHGSVSAGDTIELHYVYSSAMIQPGPTLGACLSESTMNRQLRVEGQVYVVVNDDNAADFVELTQHEVVNGRPQAINIPSDSGTPVQYAGSTTGPAYNEVASPLQVSWSMRPEVIKVNIDSVGAWCEDNVFDETGGHGVRNLVTNPALLSEIQ